jgi:hypothetical protein
MRNHLKNKIIDSFSSIFPFLLLFIVGAGLLITFFINRLDLTVRALGVGLPLLIAAIYILVKRKSWSVDHETLTTFNLLTQRNWFLLYFLVFVFSLIALLIGDYRAWYYFALIALSGLIIFFQILSPKPSSALVIIEIALISLNLSLSTTLKYPLYFGNTDYLGHIFISQITYLSEHVMPVDLRNGYNYFPFYHILVAISTNIFSLAIEKSLYIITGIVFSLNVLFVYLFFNRLIENKRIILLICLFYSFNWTVVEHNAYVITRTLAFVGFSCLLYLLVRIVRSDVIEKLRFKIISIFITIFILLMHLPSFPHLIVVLGLLFLLERYVSGKKYMDFNFMLFFIVIFLAYSIYIATSFTDTLLLQTFKGSNFDALQLKENILPGDEIKFIYNYADVFIFIFLVIIGIAFIMQKYRNDYILVSAIFALIMVVISIPSPLQMLTQVMNLFQTFRIIVIATPFLAFGTAYGIYILWNNPVKTRIGRHIQNSILIIGLAFYLFASVAVHISNDCKDFSWKEIREYFTSSEIQSFNHIEKYVTFDSDLYSDYYTARYFGKEKFSKSELLNLPYYDSNTIEHISSIFENNLAQNEYFIFRKIEYKQEGLLFGPEIARNIKSDKDYSLDNIQVQLDKDHKNRIFSNKSADIYH